MGPFTISPQDLYSAIGTEAAPTILDTCLAEDFDAEARLIPGARWRDPTAIADWASKLPANRLIVAVCVRGLKVSQAVVAELRRQGRDARALEGGNVAWREAGLPTIAKRYGAGNREGRPTRWVTRIRPKIDRIACPWLIARFIDPDAQFLFVEPDQVKAAAVRLDAVPYDIEGVELTHRGAGCSFDALLEDFGLDDPALNALALVIRGADTARPDLAPEARGLLAVSLGISALSGGDDHAALARGFAVYDAFHAWRRHAAGETHNWPAKRAGAAS